MTVFEETRVAERDGPAAAAADEEAAAGDEGAAAADEGAAAADEREITERDSRSGGTVASAGRFREAGPGTSTEGAANASFALLAAASAAAAACCSLVLAIH